MIHRRTVSITTITHLPGKFLDDPLSYWNMIRRSQMVMEIKAHTNTVSHRISTDHDDGGKLLGDPRPTRNPTGRSTAVMEHIRKIHDGTGIQPGDEK
jgi:hypothetical protein